jgi:ATP-binding cassette subfamily F protein 3
VIQLQSLTKSFGKRVLLDRVTWQVSAGERVGLCGPNGAGKTTLLRMLAGLDEPDGGGITRPVALTVGYLPQDGLTHTGRPLREEVSLAFGPLLEARAEIERIEHQLGDPDLPDGEHEHLLVRYHELTEYFRQHEGHTIEQQVAQVLQGLGFSAKEFEKPSETFSGGWQMRIALAKLLLGRPTLLLLDEPTNHLDLDARNWLETYLAAYPHPIILVSHDRFFLDAVVTKIAEISLRTITDYVGDYSRYLIERDTRLELLHKAKREQDEEIARMRAFIDRFRYQATKAAQVQSRIKLLDRIVPIDVPPERKRVHFTFPACPKSGRTVLELSGVRKAYGDNLVFDGLNLLVERGDRIALVAPNGAGKSTLMRMLAGAETPDAGARREGHQVVPQYFAQDEAARLNPAQTVYQVLEADSPVGMVPMIRSILGGFLFSGDDIHKRAGVLSGGERTRLAVARMLLRPANTLLLDEPTNHLDLDSKDVLLEALEDFGGTLIFVSHDRYFVDRLATKIIEVGHGGITVYPGTYEEFLWSKAQRTAGAAAKRPPVDDRRKPASVGQQASAPERSGAKGPLRARAKGGPGGKAPRSQQEARIADLEARIAAHEQTIKDLEAEMAEAGFYTARDAASEKIARHQQLMWEVGDLMNQWEALQLKLSERT